MGDKRCSVSATGSMFENWGVYFNKAVHIHEITGSLPEFTATNHTLAHFRVNIHIDIATTIALFFIGETITAWHRTKGFSEKLHVISEE